MNIVMAASEAVPFCKTGGLGDVVGGLARSIRQQGHRLVLFLPGYKTILSEKVALKPVPGRYWIPLGDDLIAASLLHAVWEGVEFYFVQNQKYFSREELYCEDGKDYPDNDERFIFFSRAVLEGLKFIGFKPDIIHCHDWQVALIPAYLKTLYHIDAYYVRTASVMTIHNIAYQGMFSKNTLYLTGLGWTDFTSDRLEYYGGLNFLKAGIVFADMISTVSPTYAREIQESAELGRGLEGILRRRSGDLRGILNGIDMRWWDPEQDASLASKFGVNNFQEGKRANKIALQKEGNLAVRPEAPLIGIVSRLDPQKGLDVALQAIPRFVDSGAQVAILGSGDPGQSAAFTALAAKYPSSVWFRSVFEEAASRRIYGACDIFLMPSRFEPCGLGQMLAMRYGAVPVVTRTGGLADTVREIPGSGLHQNGFVAEKCVLEEVSKAMDRALSAYSRPEAWNTLVRDVMRANFSWDPSVPQYLDLYQQASERVAG